jgi:4-amino-4-deoxy-L-arabinose transferase-like glycosyltransferase
MALGWLPGWLIFLAIAAPWFVAMQWRFPGFAHYFFVVQHFERYAASGFNNVQPFWFYPIVLIALGLPWSTWLLGALWRDRATLVGPRGPDADVLRLMLAWLGVVIVFFSLPSSKPIGYILPAGVPLGYLSARAVRSFAGFAGPGHARWRRAVASTAALAAALCVGAAILAHFYQPKSLRTLAMQLQSARLPGEPSSTRGGPRRSPRTAGAVSSSMLSVFAQPRRRIGCGPTHWRRRCARVHRPG